MRGMGGSRAERAGAARRARGRWTSVLGQPRGACHIHRHAVLASCRGAAWCPHKGPDRHHSLWGGHHEKLLIIDIDLCTFNNI